MSDDVSLEQIHIAAPCPVEWDSMTGDDRVRFCGQCKLNVYDIASMTRAEALALVAASEGDLCVQLYRRADGTVLTSDCPVGLRAAARRRLALLVAKIAAIVMVAGSALGAIRATRDAGHAGSVTSIEPFASIERWLEPEPPAPPPPRRMGGKVAIRRRNPRTRPRPGDSGNHATPGPYDVRRMAQGEPA